MRVATLVWVLLSALTAGAQQPALQELLEKNDFFSLRDRLRYTKELDAASRLYYTAFVDNGFNRNDLAIRRADSFMVLAKTVWPAQQVLRLEEMMMDSYAKAYRYAAAADMSHVILAKYADEFKAPMLNAQKIWEALRHTPPQTVSIPDNTSVPLLRNNIGLWEIPVQFGNSKEFFLFDTGANISTISQSYADKLKLKQIDVDIEVRGGQGKTVRSKMGVADSLSIGTAVVRKVVFLIMPDEQLEFRRMDFTINGIIGFPVINALREIHLTKDSLLIPARPTPKKLNNLALSGLTPLLQARVNEDTLVFQFDTGAAATDLYSNYFEKHREEIEQGGRMVKKKFMSAGGGRNIKVYESGRQRLYVGGEMATLYNVSIHTAPVHQAGRSIASGNMGQDVIRQFREMTINFESMYISFR